MEGSFQKKHVSIGKAAEFLNVSVDTIRRWDEKGILHPTRPDGKNRYFSIEELEKVKFSQPLTISEAAQRLEVSEVTLRRLEEKGLIKPDRDENGNRIYTLDCLEKFIESDYYLRRKEIEDKILSAPETSTTDHKDYLKDVESLREQHKIISARLEDQNKHIRTFSIFRKTIYASLSTFATLVLILIVLFTLLFIAYPEGTGRWFGFYIPRASAEVSSPVQTREGKVLGATYISPSYNQPTILAQILRPIGGLSLELTRQINSQSYDRVIPANQISNINDIFSVDANKDIVANYNFTFPDTSYFKIPDKNLISNLNADYLRGRVPGSGSGDLTYFDGNNSIAGLVISQNNLDDRGISDIKLSQITSPNKVAGSAIQLFIGGGLENHNGLSLKTSCNANEILQWNGSSWICAINSGTPPTYYSAVNPLAYNPATGVFSISDAAADGATKGISTFTASDFDAAAGVISIDYANGQAASAGTKGFLTAADWSTFNSKQPAGNYITGLTGDVTATGPGSVAATIASGAVSLSKMANLPANTIIGNNTGAPATPLALSVSDTKTLLSLNNVEDTALSTWIGSINITTLGTIGTGTWNGTIIADGKIASALTGKTYNGLTITTSTGTLTIADGKTLTASNSLTLTGTDTSSIAFGTGGTVAYASDLSSYVPYTGATTDVNLGTWELTAGRLKTNSDLQINYCTSMGDILFFSDAGVTLYGVIHMTGLGYYGFSKGNTGINAILNFSSLATSDKTFTFPNTTGTLALTSDLSAYLKLDTSNDPLTGNLEISKADPEIKLTDTGDGNSTRITRSDTNALAVRYNTVYKPGTTGYSLQLDAASKYGTLSSWNMGTVHTISAWVKFNSGASIDIFSWGGGNDPQIFYTGQGGGAFYRIYPGDDVSFSSSAFTAGTWYHLTIVRNGTSVSFYVNGSQVDTTKTLSANTAPTVKYLGYGGWGGGTVQLDEIKVWSSDLTAAQVLADYNAGAGIYGSAGGTLIGGWHFGEGAGTTTADYSGSGRAITLVGSPPWLAGYVYAPGADTEVLVWQSQDGIGGLEEGIQTFGDPDGRTVIQGQKIAIEDNMSMQSNYLLWGTLGSEDTNLYRSAADTLKTDDTLIANTLTFATGSITDSTGTISFDNENLTTTGTIDIGTTTLLASRALTVDTGGVFNIATGSAAGDDFTVDTNKLMVEGDTGYLTVPGVYANTDASAANVYVDSNGLLYRSTSSAKYKTNIRDLEVDTSKIYSLTPRSYEAKNDGTTHFGLIAEEVQNVIPELVSYDKDGNPNGVEYQYLSVLLLNELKKINDHIGALETKSPTVLFDAMNKLEGRTKDLEGQSKVLEDRTKALEDQSKSGITKTVNVKGNDGDDCTMTYSSGLLTVTTCPQN